MRTRRRFISELAFALSTLGFRGTADATLEWAGLQTPAAQREPTVQLPNANGSLKFGVLGDFGTGNKEQYQMAEQMAKVHAKFPLDLMITVGDNIYGGERPQDMQRKFEAPYKALLDAGLKFYASLGNHDARDQSRYNLFNMDGKTYYTFKAPRQDVRFFALESDYPTPAQIQWLEKELAASGERWKIPYFHHPLYASGMHGSNDELRKVLEPMFVKYGVTVVFTGHEHFYERIKPQQGIVHFVTGAGGQLRRGDIDRRTGLTAVGFDTDRSFMAIEIDDDKLVFNSISRPGDIIDSGIIERRKPPQ
jgi:calcineurin-like phosphoesterase family protein